MRKVFISLMELGKAMRSIETLLLLAKRLRQRLGYFLPRDAQLDIDSIWVGCLAGENPSTEVLHLSRVGVSCSWKCS